MQKKLNQFRTFSWILVTVVSLLLLSACANRKEIKIQFETNGGSLIEDITYSISDPVDLPEPTKEGYIFSGWYLDEALTDVFDVESVEDEEIILYAKWEDDHLVTITYNAMGGSSDQVIESMDNQLPTIYVPFKDGYLFSGWYLDETYDETYIYDEPLTEDTILYAKWELRTENILTVFYSDQMIYEFNITDGSLPELTPTVPEPYASETVGFFKDPEMRRPLSTSEMITSSTTIYARVSDAYYLYYDQIEIAQPDQYISQTQVLKDGVVYEQKNLMYDKETLEPVKLYRPLTSFYEFPIDFKITSIEYVHDELLIETNDGSQYFKNFHDSFRPSALRDARDQFDLHDEEKIEHFIDVLHGAVIITTEGRILYDGYSNINLSIEHYDSVDITDDISLQENETLLADNIFNDLGYGFKTSSGRVFVLTKALEAFDVFETLDETKVFTECNQLLSSSDEIITLMIDGSSIFYITAHGNVYYQKDSSSDLIDYQLLLEDGEEVVDFFGNIIFTSHHRYLEMDSFDYYLDVTSSKFDDIVIESTLKNPYTGEMFIETTDSKFYYFKTATTNLFNGSVIENITESFQAHDLSLENVKFYDVPIMFKDGHYYSFGTRYSINELTFGFISTLIDGPYNEGDEVNIKTYDNESHYVKGYDSVSYEIDSNQISMPTKDLFMRLSFESNRNNTLHVRVYDDSYNNYYIDYTPGDEITYEDIKDLIPESREIDFIVNLGYRTIVELPLKTATLEDYNLSIAIYTKPKTDALSVAFNVYSDDQYFGTETFYASIGDTIETYVNYLDYYGFEIEAIYQDEDMTILYDPNQELTADSQFYVHVSQKELKTITIHINDQTFYRSFDQMFYMSKDNIAYVLDLHYQASVGILIEAIYFDEEKTSLLEINYMLYESTEIWVDADINYEIRLYEVNAFNEISYTTFIDYDGQSISDLLNKRMIRDLYKIDRIFLDEQLTIELFDGDEIPYRVDELYITIAHADGIEITIHMYDQDEVFIETLVKESLMATVENFVTAHGYSSIEFYTDPDFENPYPGDNTYVEVLYGKATLDYVTIEVINAVTDEVFNIKHPKNQTFNPYALTDYITDHDAGYMNLLYYKDEALTEAMPLEQVTLDMTLYMTNKDDDGIELSSVILSVSGDVEFEKEVYLPSFYSVRLKELMALIETELELSNRDVEIMMYSDPELTMPIFRFTSNEYDVVYIDISITTIYTVTIIDPILDEIMWTLDFKSGLSVNLNDVLANVYNESIPFEFSNDFTNEYFLDEALTIPVETIVVTEDMTIYVKVVPAATYTITYQFIGIELDDLVLTLAEHEDMSYRNEVYTYVYGHLDENVQAKLTYIFSGKPTITVKPTEDTTILVDVDLTQYHEVEFIYDFEGKEEHEVYLYEDGVVLEDSIFYDRLFENPNDYDIYFYTDEAMTDGSLTVVVDQDMVLYLKLVRKY